MTDTTTVGVSRSGFDWADVEWRFLAFDGRFYAYGPTGEEALRRFQEMPRDAG